MAQRTCERCGNDLPPYCGGPPRKWCSAKCQREPTPATLRQCVHCGQDFESRRGTTRCSYECRAARDRASLNTSSRRRGNYRERAQAFGVEYQRFDRVEIFEHGWTCGICSRPVDRSLRHPHLMSASLDHIVPLSRGGAHSPGNTQCSHLICNIEKGARLVSQD